MTRTKQDGNRLTVFLEGEIDHYSAQPLREEIEFLIRKQEIKQLVFDFSMVTLMDSSGVGMIIGRYKTMTARGGQVIAAGLHPPVDRLFHLAGLHRIIAVEPAKEQEDL